MSLGLRRLILQACLSGAETVVEAECCTAIQKSNLKLGCSNDNDSCWSGGGGISVMKFWFPCLSFLINC